MSFVSIQFDDNNEQPKYMQLFFQIKDKIVSGELENGFRLPSVRSLAGELEINPATVVAAYKELEVNRYVNVKKGSGYYVNIDREKDAKVSPIRQDDSVDYINFAGATPNPRIFPTDTFKDCINQVIDRDRGYAFGYQDINGYRELRESLSIHLKKYNSIGTSSDKIQVVSGSQQGIDLVGKTLISPGDYVLTETPTYYGAVDAFSSRGGRIVGVKMESDGVDLLDLERKVRICKPRFMYVMTQYQNPTSVSYSKDKLQGLLELAEKYSFLIVEDDSMSEISFDKAERSTLKALDTKDRVIYIKSFSKLLMPGLRVGCLVLPADLMEGFARTKQSTDISSSGLIQRALDLYLRSGKWDEHINYMGEIYNGKYEVMLDKLNNLKKLGISFTEPGGGLYFWIKLPSKISSLQLSVECKKRGLLLLPSPAFFPNDNKLKDNFVRLSFASAEVKEIKDGMDILQDVIMKYHQ